MTPLGDIREHLLMVRRMARATGVDLNAAMHEGVLKQDDWSQMVTNCRGCQRAEACARWLSGHELGDTGRDRAPEYCENRASFDQMALAPAN